MVLKKSKKDNGTLFIDASRECIKVTNNNKLTPKNIEKIVVAYSSRETTKHFTRLVPNSEITEQNYNLSVSAYVEQEDTRQTVNITELNDEIERIVVRGDVLRREIAAIIAEIESSE
jgi:type I restriction enzyme M protein